MDSLLPVVLVGDYIQLVWESENIVCRVVKVKKCDDIKKGSNFKYFLSNIKTEEEIKTRLIHLEYKKISDPNTDKLLSQKRLKSPSIPESIKKPKTLNLSTTRQCLPIHKYILAPMV